jgi:hypothetical protein
MASPDAAGSSSTTINENQTEYTTNVAERQEVVPHLRQK